jgi:PIN domain nuclease of toxin-antitoxin system
VEKEDLQQWIQSDSEKSRAKEARLHMKAETHMNLLQRKHARPAERAAVAVAEEEIVRASE